MAILQNNGLQNNKLQKQHLHSQMEESTLAALSNLDEELEVLLEKEGWIFLHPEKGILMVSVQLGEVQYHEALQLWYKLDDKGNRHSIPDPCSVMLAERANLLQKVLHLPFFLHNPLYKIRSAFCFPASNTDGFPLPPAFSADCLIDQRQMAELQQKVDQIYEKPEDASSLNREPPAFRTTEGNSLTLPPFFKGLVKEEESQIKQLTEDQCRVLAYMEEEPRVGVVGSAGTGKTLLAYEKARRLAESGKRTLLTCYNVPLEAHLKSLGEVENLTILRFHQLCVQSAKEVGNFVEEHEPEHQDRLYWNYILPTALRTALQQGLERYDAIVIDEAQDMAEHYAEPLFACLKDPIAGEVHAFYDEKQSLYQPMSHLILDLPRYDLSVNLRNSQRIHALSLKFGGDLLSHPVGPMGRKPELLLVENEDYLEDELGQILDQLIEEEGIAPEKIAILTGKRPDRLQMALYDEIGVYSVTRADAPEEGRVILDSIYRFKGLDAPVVILTNLGGFPPERLAALLYVGITRAKSHLIFKEREEFYEQLGMQEMLDSLS